MQPPAGQLIELVSVMTVAVPIMVKIAPITMKANPRVWNECLHAGTGVICLSVGGLRVNGLNSSDRKRAPRDSWYHGGEGRQGQADRPLGNRAHLLQLQQYDGSHHRSDWC